MEALVGIDPQLVENDKPVDRPVHCPFGCTVDDIDDLGYCKHLLGFTNDGKNCEPVSDKKSYEGEDLGYKFVNGKKSHLIKILTSDVLVNPQETDRRGKVWSKWVSSRVYRNVKQEAKAAKGD